jgi:hypothetical protein
VTAIASPRAQRRGAARVPRGEAGRAVAERVRAEPRRVEEEINARGARAARVIVPRKAHARRKQRLHDVAVVGARAVVCRRGKERHARAQSKAWRARAQSKARRARARNGAHDARKVGRVGNRRRVRYVRGNEKLVAQLQARERALAQTARAIRPPQHHREVARVHRRGRVAAPLGRAARARRRLRAVAPEELIHVKER